MGNFFMNGSGDKKRFIRELTDPNGFGKNLKLIDHRVVGSNLWLLVHNVEENRKFILLNILKKETGGGWYYKPISEDGGPNDVNCPLSLLKQADPPKTDYATEWRKRVVAYHAMNKAMPEPYVGLRVKYGKLEYELVEKLGSRRGWNVRISDGTMYRMNIRQIADALRNLVGNQECLAA